MADAWGAPPASPPPLDAGVVHVWRASLRPSPAVLARLERHLDADERDRASRYRFPALREAFVAGRGVQREILSRYVDASPASLRYALSAHGKPELSGPAAARGIRFNVSNSGDLALFAITVGRRVGVDLEWMKEMDDAMDVARRFFSAPENEVFAALPAEVRHKAFFHCWTRKEAYIKAVGEGLSMPLDRFDVAFAPGHAPRLLATRGDPDEAGRWSLREVHPGPGYAGALIVEGDDWTPHFFDWDAGDR